MKYPLLLLTIATTLLFTSCDDITKLFISCDDNPVSFGIVEYYPQFLWVDAKEMPVTKTFYFDFSEDAKADASVFAELQFIDNEGHPMSTDIMQVYVDGQALDENVLHLDNTVDSMSVEFHFNSNRAKSGNYQGRLKLVQHNLDRLDSQMLSPNEQADVFVWTLKYEKVMNPLAKVLMWISIIICSVLAIWFIFLRPMFYPHFGKFRKSILIEQNGQIIGQVNFLFNGARKVMFSNKQVKQSIWSRIFVGKTKTLVYPAFKSQLTFVPKKKNAVAYGNGYVIKPNPIPRNGIAEITHAQQKLKITIR